jgi:hypothetical protein
MGGMMPRAAPMRLASLVVLALVQTAHADLARTHAHRRTSDIAVDGHLDDTAWLETPREKSPFVQRFPQDGASPSYKTEFAVLYDNEAVYVGVWCTDPEPSKVRALLTRRDLDSPADSVAIGFDSYHDRRTAFVFQLNAAGVQRDWLVFDDQSTDDTWDAVWTGDAVTTADGWTAEFRIPLAQLRYPQSDAEQEWGFQMFRTIGRTSEQDAWSRWPRSTLAIASVFGVVDNIVDLPPSPRLELLPYVTGGFNRSPVAPGDLVNSHYGHRLDGGLDVKYGLGPAFTLSATINPDFAQVEADPSVINLSANEIFFAEKRPFFIEELICFSCRCTSMAETRPKARSTAGASARRRTRRPHPTTTCINRPPRRSMEQGSLRARTGRGR